MPYSVYENCITAFMQIKTILCLPWGLFIDPADEKYYRFLSKQKRWSDSKVVPNMIGEEFLINPDTEKYKKFTFVAIGSLIHRK